MGTKPLISTRRPAACPRDPGSPQCRSGSLRTCCGRRYFENILFLLLLPSTLFATEKIPPVVVSKPLSHSHQPNVVISSSELQKQGVSSLTEALQTFGGIQLQDTTGNGSQVAISMRGFGVNASSNSLLLINGIPFTNPDIAPPNLNQIPIDDIAFIEIYTGSESVLYGDQAVGGVINIITRKKLKNNFTLSCGIGSYNKRECNGGLQNQWKAIRYAMNVGSSHTDNYRAHNDYDLTNFSGEMLYPYANGSLQFNYKIDKEKMLYPGALTAAEVDQNRRAANNDIDFFSDWGGFFHLRHLQSINDDWMIETDITRRTMDGNGVLFSPFTQSRIIDFIKPEIKGKIGSILTEGGIDLESDHYTLDTAFGETIDKLQKYGVFTLIKIPSGNKLIFSMGGRAAVQYSDLQSPDDINVTNHAAATTIDGTYQYTEKTSFYLRRAGSFRFPKADEMASTTPGTILKTQQGVAYETGVSTEWMNLSSQFSLFQLNLHDEITFDPTQTAEDPFGTNRNLPPTERIGFSINEKYEISNSVALTGQYHYVNAKFSSGINKGKQIPSVAENIFHVGLDYHFLEDWNLFNEAIYTGSQYPANDDANVSQKIGGYIVYNVNLHYQLQQFSASFRINNLFNKFYNLYTVYTPSTNTDTFYPAPGRNFYFTMKYEWV